MNCGPFKYPDLSGDITGWAGDGTSLRGNLDLLEALG